MVHIEDMEGSIGLTPGRERGGGGGRGKSEKI